MVQKKVTRKPRHDRPSPRFLFSFLYGSVCTFAIAADSQCRLVLCLESPLLLRESQTRVFHVFTAPLFRAQCHARSPAAAASPVGAPVGATPATRPPPSTPISENLAGSSRPHSMLLDCQRACTPEDGDRRDKLHALRDRIIAFHVFP